MTFAKERELIRIIGIREWLLLTLRLDQMRDWFLRIYHCHHNARVIADFEHRMTIVLCECTRGMSKPYYTVDAMLSEIRAKQSEDYDEAYAEGRKDALEEMGVTGAR